MDLHLNEEVIQTTLQESADKATKEAFDSYEIRNKMREAVAAQFLDGILPDAMAKAVAQTDLDSLAEVLARGLTEGLGYAMRSLMASAFADVIAKLRGIQTYESGYDERLKGIRQEVLDSCKTIRGEED